MNKNTETNLLALHDAIKAQIAAKFPQFETVDYYRDDTEDLNADELPACFFELIEMDDASDVDPGTEQWATSTRWEARFILGYKTPAVRMEARLAASQFALWLRQLIRWEGQKGGPIEIVGCYPDDFSPHLDRFDIWRCEWTQILHIGPSVWTNEGTTPTAVFLGASPDIGTGNEEKYTQVAP